MHIQPAVESYESDESIVKVNTTQRTRVCRGAARFTALTVLQCEITYQIKKAMASCNRAAVLCLELEAFFNICLASYLCSLWRIILPCSGDQILYFVHPIKKSINSGIINILKIKQESSEFCL